MAGNGRTGVLSGVFLNASAVELLELALLSEPRWVEEAVEVHARLARLRLDVAQFALGVAQRLLGLRRV